MSVLLVFSETFNEKEKEAERVRVIVYVLTYLTVIKTIYTLNFY